MSYSIAECNVKRDGVCFFAVVVCLSVPIIDLKADLTVGSMLIWAGLGCANVVAVICLALYLFTKLEWEDAIRESNARLRQTIDSAKES